MSRISLGIAFHVGQGASRPAILPFDLAFRVGEGAGQPSIIRLNVAFRVQGLGRPARLFLPLAFKTLAAQPTIFVYTGGDWLAVAQQVWTGTEWITGS